MNAVLQALVHAPPLRNFWLSGQHNRDLCERRSMGLLCLPCDLDLIFSAMFSGDRTPYSPAHLLYRFVCFKHLVYIINRHYLIANLISFVLLLCIKLVAALDESSYL